MHEVQQTPRQHIKAHGLVPPGLSLGGTGFVFPYWERIQGAFLWRIKPFCLK
jgi:hypothetical protein